MIQHLKNGHKFSLYHISIRKFYKISQIRAHIITYCILCLIHIIGLF